MGIEHTQCLLRVDGSILAGVLTSSFVVPESSDSSIAASSSLFVHVELGTQNCSSAANSTESTVHGFFQRLAYYRRQPQTLVVVQL